MSTQVIPFDFENQKIRTLVINTEPWFVAADVCNAINLKNPTKAIANLDDDEKALTSIQGLSRGNDKANIINESGLYTLILRCRDAIKKGTLPHRFRKWVTSEVLPTIRKTGSYSTHTEPISISSLPAYTHRVLTYLSYGLPVASMLLAEDQIVMSVESFTEILKQRGLVLICPKQLVTKISALLV